MVWRCYGVALVWYGSVMAWHGTYPPSSAWSRWRGRGTSRCSRWRSSPFLTFLDWIVCPLVSLYFIKVPFWRNRNRKQLLASYCSILFENNLWTAFVCCQSNELANKCTASGLLGYLLSVVDTSSSHKSFFQCVVSFSKFLKRDSSYVESLIE